MVAAIVGGEHTKQQRACLLSMDGLLELFLDLLLNDVQARDIYSNLDVLEGISGKLVYELGCEGCIRVGQARKSRKVFQAEVPLR